MQLSPLQSRLAASLLATLCLLALYFLLLMPRGALAYDMPLESISSWTYDSRSMKKPVVDARSPWYESPFNLFSRTILGRAGDTVPLDNNKPLEMNIQPGVAPVCYVIRKGSLRASNLQNGANSPKDKVIHENASRNTTIYLSANTCTQPTMKAGGKLSKPPQLILFVSNGTTAACPQITNGPAGEEANGFTLHMFTEGAVTVDINATADIYVGIYAPKIADGFDGFYDYQIAASGTEFFHQYRDNVDRNELLWMDSDSTSALLVTQSLTYKTSEARRLMSQSLPYELYVSVDGVPTLDGLRHSACGLQKNALTVTNRQGSAAQSSASQGSARASSSINTVMTMQGAGGALKQQFYVVGLNAQTSYSGMLVRPANVSANSKRQQDGSRSAARAGSVVFAATNFSTNAASNCKVVTNLEFCNEIQYAVPGNDGKFNNTELAKVYDNYAKTMYSNFQKILQQIPCEAERTSQYSLARTCLDCERAYKRWLCSVSMPRCEDFSGGSSLSVIRNVNQAFPNGSTLPAELRQSLGRTPSQNASRNSFIDATIQPGPYREIMPCEDICYQVVQSCPAKIGFKCPQPGMDAFNVSYGRRDGTGPSSVVSCNFPGEARTPASAASSLVSHATRLLWLVALLPLLS